LLPATGGTVTLDGTDLAGVPTDRIAASGFALMPGGRGVFPTLTVDDNLRLATWLLRSDPAAASAAREEMLELFPALRERLAIMAGNLSGGEQQMLSLAMAFVTKPNLLRSVFIGSGPSGPAESSDGRAPAPLAGNGLRLTCQGITRRFGGLTALDGVDLDVAPGRAVGIIGHNGAGKTTLFDVISGFLASDAGQVLLDGVDVTGSAPHRRAVAGLGRSFQEARLFPSLTAAETVAVALERHLPNRDTL